MPSLGFLKSSANYLGVQTECYNSEGHLIFSVFKSRKKFNRSNQNPFSDFYYIPLAQNYTNELKYEFLRYKLSSYQITGRYVQKDLPIMGDILNRH